MLHTIIAEKIQFAQETFDMRMRELRSAQRILDQLGLLPMLDQAVRFSVHEDTLYDYHTGERQPADRYWITIRLPAEARPAVHPLLRATLDTVGEWNADYRVERDYAPKARDLLIECWTADWDHLDHSSAWNALHVEYASDAVEGATLSPTCSVQQVTHRTEATTTTALAVVCNKNQDGPA